MTKETNSNIQAEALTKQYIKKCEAELEMQLSVYYRNFLLADNLTSLNNKVFYFTDKNSVTAHIIKDIFPVYRSEQEEPYQVPLKLKEKKLVVDYTAMLSSKATGFCLLDWNYHIKRKHIGSYLPIGISKDSKSLICLGMYAGEYGKIYIYTKKSCKRYDLFLLANNFADLVAKLVEPETALVASQLFKYFNKEDIKALTDTVRLRQLNRITNTKKTVESPILSTTLKNHQRVIVKLMNNLTRLEASEIAYKQMVYQLKQALVSHIQE